MAGLGHTALLTPRPPGICRGWEPAIIPELAGVREAREVTPCGPHRHRHRALAPASGLQGLTDRRQAPGVPLLVACECETPQTFRLFRDSLDLCLKDELLRRCGTHHRAAPA